MSKKFLATLALVCAVGGADASLVLQGRDSGGSAVDVYDPTAVMEYDPNADTTWLRDWNQGYSDFYAVLRWASSLSYAGASGWRVPTRLDYARLYSESGSNGPTGLIAAGFKNVAPDTYWSDDEGPNGGRAWVFYTGNGTSVTTAKPYQNYFMAVRDGDVLAAPIPATSWLMISGIGALGAAARRRRAVVQQP
jgi:Protein of unknown function (DUF1566)